MGFPGGSVVRNLPANAGDVGLIPGLGRSPGEGNGITLSTQVCLVKAMVFAVVMDGCKSWTVKKAEHRRIDAFEL